MDTQIALMLAQDGFVTGAIYALMALALVLVAVLSGRQIASTLRNHRELGHLANPVAALSAGLSYAHHLRGTVAVVAAPLGRDARRESECNR